MKHILLLFLTMGAASFAQTKPNSKYLTKLFKNSIEQKDRKWISVHSNPWVINNIDSAYYKLDTLKAYSYKKGSSKYCEYIGWTFYKKDSFVLVKAHLCDEPPKSSVPKKEDWYNIKFIENEKVLIMQLYNFDKLITQFAVLAIEESDSTATITLLRKR